MTKGFKSTEFWAAVGTVAVGFLMQRSGASVEAILTVAAPAMTYIGGRSLAKHGNNGK